MIEYPINLNQKPLFWLGDRFFKVEENKNIYRSGSRIEFVSKCPSCNDTKKIKYIGCDGNEYEAECPLCAGSIYKGAGNRIKLIKWEVHEYIVYGISGHGSTTVSSYKHEIAYMDSLSLTAFCKTGRGMDDYAETHVPFVENVVDPEINTADMSAIEERRVYDYVFKKKKDAEKLCEMLKDYDRTRLEKFNEKYGTNHKYPY